MGWSSYPGYLGRGVANSELGNFDRAISDFDAALLVNADSADAYFYRGRAHFALDHYPEALADFERAAKLAPDRTSPRAYIAEISGIVASLNSSPAAPPLAALSGIVPSKAIGRTHQCASYYPLLSEQLAEGGNSLIAYDVGADGAISNVRLDKSSGIERLDRAAILCVQTHWRNTPSYKDGIAVASAGHEAIIQCRPDTDDEIEAATWRANAYSALGDYPKAVDQFDFLIKAKPNDAEWLLRRGLVHYVAHDYTGAIADFDQALRLKPDFEDAAVARALSVTAHAADAARPPPKGAI